MKSERENAKIENSENGGTRKWRWMAMGKRKEKEEQQRDMKQCKKTWGTV